ncbi:MAG: YkgJ family cysteine cluster protein [Dehalogenimonas sp.]
MASYTTPETKMFAKWYGNKDLVNNEEFWADCLVQYLHSAVILPLVDNPTNRFRLHRMLVCPPGTCGKCCSCYDSVPLSDYDAGQIAQHNDCRPVHMTINEANKLSLVTKGGCPFLKDNACSIYEHRPFVCTEYPIQSPMSNIDANGTKFEQITYRLGCEPALKVIRATMEEAVVANKAILLPDLTLIPEYKEN